MLEGFPIYISGIHANISVGTLLWHPPITRDNDDIYHMGNIAHVYDQHAKIMNSLCSMFWTRHVWYVAFLLSHTWSHQRFQGTTNAHFCTLLAVKQRHCILMDIACQIYMYMCLIYIHKMWTNCFNVFLLCVSEPNPAKLLKHFRPI